MIDFDRLTVDTFGVNLGASPAELAGDLEAGRQRSWASHDAEAELKLWEDGHE